MEQDRNNTPFSWINFIDILDSSKIGLWSIEIDNNTGINRMYCNDTMLSLIDANNNFSPERCFEYWYSKIHKGYYSYVQKAIEEICSTNESVEIQYPWKHPKLGDIMVRCSGKLISIKNGIINIKGYHQNINDLNQMKVVLSKVENEIFEWYQDSKTAYVHTNYNQIYEGEANIEGFPEVWIENGNVHEYFKETYLEAFERINNGSQKSICELKIKNKDGDYTWFKLTLSKENSYADISNVVIGTLENINTLKEMEIAYVIESRFYNAILKEMMGYAEINLTNSRFISTGGIWSEYNNISNEFTVSEIIEKNIFKVIYPEDRKAYSEFLNTKNLLKKYNNGINISKFEFRRIISKEVIKWTEVTVSLFQEPYKKDILGLIYLRDIDTKKREELLLKYEVTIDDLTGLFNKATFNENVKTIIEESDKDSKFCMLLLDIDDFKKINYSSNLIGDEVLKYISNILKYIFRNQEILSRIGGDEFAVFIKNADKEEVKDKISKFYLKLKEFEKYDISCSIGACFSKKANYIDLYSCCDKALHKIKNQSHYNTVLWNDYIQNFEELEIVNNQDIKKTNEKTDFNNYSDIEQLISNEGDMAYVIDAFDYKIVDGNETFFKTINKNKQECIGKECFKVLHNREKPCNLCKNIFWKYNDFFVWNQYNKVLNQEFLLKNKLVSFNNKKCMLTLATNTSFIEENNNNIDEKIVRNIFSSIFQLSKEYSYKENIDFILELMCSFYKSELGLIFEINKNNSIITHSFSYNNNNIQLKNEIEDIILNEFIPSPISNTKYLNCPQEAIYISYNLYNCMMSSNLLNMLIIPITNNNKHIAYAIFINNYKIDDNLYNNNLEYYSLNMSYFIKDEILKNRLIADLDLEKNYDSLTGILNRNAYRKYEKQYDSDSIYNIGVVCLALNELNNINHTAGIIAGDQILINLANTLKVQFDEDNIFRLNGNEFLIIMENIEYELFLKEIDILSKSLEKIGLSMTYGKAWSSDEKELGNIVNSAIYLRKMENQKNKELINASSLCKRNTLLSELMRSIETKEYEIFLQPKMYLKDNKLCGAEALIRKRNSEGGYVPPNKFIPILEHHYLIQYIDLFVFEEVLKLLESWQKQGRKLIPISLNFSRRTLLEDDIIKMVIDIKNKYNVDPSYVEIEVTESIGDLEKQAICMLLKEIENIGMNILLDDFGVKYSNLTILSDISFDGLKIDKSMIKNLGENTTNDVIIKNIICMCKELNIKTIAEGVETTEQESILRSINCDMVQGYLYSKPLPVSEFLEKYGDDISS